MSWIERHPKTVLALWWVVVLLAAEGGARLLTASGVLPYVPYAVSRESTFWADLDPAFGVWHRPGATYRHRSPCFDVVYRTNSWGARDAERSRESGAERRVVVLGDSFVEGIGVERDRRLTNLLERRTGVEHLNFGTSGSFGSVQQWVQYRTLVEPFDHTDVLLFFLPDNDIRDNRPEEFPAERFRPYLVERDGGFDLDYPVAFEDRRVEKRSPGRRIRNAIFNASHLVNVIRSAWKMFETRIEGGVGAIDEEEASYDRSDEDGVEILLESYRRLAGDVGPDRTLWIFVIPRYDDLAEALASELDGTIPARVATFAANEPNVRFVDLLPGFLRYAGENDVAIADFFHPCDGHWSPLGHEVAAEIVAGAVHGRERRAPGDGGRGEPPGGRETGSRLPPG